MKALPAPQHPLPQLAPPPLQKSMSATSAARAIEVAKSTTGTGDLVDDLINAVNSTFIEDKSQPKQAQPKPGTLDVSREGVEDLFAEIAAQYARPLKEFVIELRRGTATRDWLDICRPALASISKAARSMNLAKAAERMDAFDTALASMAKAREKTMSAQEQAKLLEGYDRLVEVMPKAFSVNEEMKRRDTIIILALLKQIPDVGRVTIDKLYSAGLTTVDVLMLAKRDELAVATGIPGRIAEQICARLLKYREESSGTKRVDLKGYRQRLYELVTGLKKANDAFNKAAAADNFIEKRAQRNARQNSVFQISILLAELGESEFVKECDKLTFERRIQALDEFLARTAQRK